MIETKTDKVKSLIRQREWKKALSIVKTFRRGLTRDESSTICIAYECMCGHERFYESIGVNVKLTQDLAKLILLEKYA